jgi:hypothetical protein
MKVIPPLALVLFLLGSSSIPSAFGQETVTIPKSRLEELERKEKELEKLKAQPVAPPRPITPPPRTGTLAPAPPRESPPLGTLPPLKEGETVEAIDLANYFRQDPTAADKRFRKAKLTVRGEIAAFEKPMFQRDYHVLLQTGDRDTRVICRLFPPDKFSAVFTVNHGAELVGVMGETRVPMARVGETVLIKGVCKGFKDGIISIAGGELSRP